MKKSEINNNSAHFESKSDYVEYENQLKNRMIRKRMKVNVIKIVTIQSPITEKDVIEYLNTINSKIYK